MSNGVTVADVGTDHGYIPIYLVESGKNKCAIAMDINRGPLDRAEAHIRMHGLGEQIKTRLSDGVQKLQIGECDCVIVAGMGGGLVIKIMEDGEEIFRNLTEFILQPQSEIAKVRQYLCEHNYRIIAEDQRKTSCFKIVFRKGRKDKRANLQTAKEGRRNTYCIPDSGT